MRTALFIMFAVVALSLVACDTQVASTRPRNDIATIDMWTTHNPIELRFCFQEPMDKEEGWTLVEAHSWKTLSAPASFTVEVRDPKTKEIRERKVVSLGDNTMWDID